MGKLLGDRTARRVVELVNAADGTQANITRRRDNLVPGSLTYRNDSGEAVPAYGCMRLTGAEEDPNTGRQVVVIQKPNSTGGVFVFNGSRETASGEYGTAYAGVVRAAFASGTPAAGETWGPLSTWNVEAGGNPAILVYGDIDTDMLYGTTDIGTVIKHAKADGAITFGSSGTVSIWDGSTLADTTVNVTAYLDWMHGSENISSGKELLIQWFPNRGKWQIIGADCE